MTGIGRRALLAGLAASWAGSISLRAAELTDAPAADAPRVAALDWGIASTLLAMGIVPVGVPAPSWCDRYVVDPALPASVVDVGLLFTPNFEVLMALAPSLIVTTPTLQQAAPMLQRIAPVYSDLLFQPTSDVLEIAERGTLGLADRIGRLDAGERFVESTRAELARTGQRLSGYTGSPVLLASPLDNRHLSLFGPNSLYGAVLRHIGLPLAEPDIAGEFVIVGLEKLGAYNNATMVMIDSPIAPGMASRLTENRLWRTLPFVREGRLRVIPTVLGSGGLPSASRFARLLTIALGENGGGTP